MSHIKQNLYRFQAKPYYLVCRYGIRVETAMYNNNYKQGARVHKKLEVENLLILYLVLLCNIKPIQSYNSNRYVYKCAIYTCSIVILLANTYHG